MDFGSLMFLSFRIMHHLFIQLNTNTGYYSGSILVLLLGETVRGGETEEERGREERFKIKQWADVIVYAYVYACVC